ncbi:ankyrin repeat domain-containing protein 12 isoform X2 [Diachasma alloeum]|uniref:ankyrin repeat domain-containing protein 12 isoform X2 n=1 Tax=Diachasma alloeum TaxID=454923 RepID=UPI0007383859|nr:ankyrin repeat domain-containing protein 12 isoform X2 [Diachasma alloeum]
MPAGGNSRFRGYPARMSERQQLALLLQMTSQEIVPSGVTRPETLPNQSTPRSSSLTHHRGSKSRWSTKNDESPTYRKEDYPRRSMIFSGYEIGKESHEATGANPSEETSSPDSPRSPSSETGTGAPPIVRQDQHDSQNYQQSKVYQHQRPTGNTSAGTKQDAEDSGDLCEMRRTPPQNKVDRSGSGTGSSPRVTLRLNQVRGVRDDKKSAGSGSRQSMSGANQGQMEAAKSTPSTVQGSSSTTTTTTTTAGAQPSTPSSASSSAGAPAVDNSDVYEFKSSKEATPVRGSSSSPNPPEKEKDTPKASGGASQVEAPASSSESTPAAAGGAGAAEGTAAGSPSAKRAYEGNEDEQDEENRRKKRKESEGSKDAKGPASGRASAGRAAVGASEKSDKLASVVTASSIVEQCPKTGKQGAVPPGKPQQSSTPSDRKSPSSISASSPKPLTTPPTKTSTPAPESDSEDDRPKSSDSSSAPKVPPLKIVIPQTTEQEQTRNGKNPSTRGHQLPYVVASSNSNDSTDKDQTQSTSGTTSPTEASASSKSEEKKDFSGAIHSEERSTHHQRVLRSAHRGNGNGSSNSKDSNSNQSGNGSYSNSSPLPAADRSNNTSPQPPATEGPAEPAKSASEPAAAAPKATANSEKSEKSEGNGKSTKEGSESSENSSGSSNANASVSTAAPVELHPRKRKMKPSKEAQQAVAASNEASETANAGTEVHPHDQPITNCYQLFLNIRKQIERRRKGLFPVQPKPPQGFKDYLMNRCTYVLAGNANKEPNVNPPGSLQGPMKELYVEQEKERYRLRMQHVVEKEKLVLSVEQEILRVHGRAARALANQILPFSVCTILKDEEVYNVITPEQEEKDRNQRSRYNGRLFLSWLQDVDDKWEKIKEAMLLRHHNEAESLHAVQRMDWEWKLKEVGLCEFKATPQIDDLHVPIVHVSDDFDLLPA